jgi:hypothetical protein
MIEAPVCQTAFAVRAAAQRDIKNGLQQVLQAVFLGIRD